MLSSLLVLGHRVALFYILPKIKPLFPHICAVVNCQVQISRREALSMTVYKHFINTYDAFVKIALKNMHCNRPLSEFTCFITGNYCSASGHILSLFRNL